MNPVLDPALKYDIEKALDEHVVDVRTVSGGCISSAAHLITDRCSYFVKWGDAAVARTFSAEAAGLAELASGTVLLKIPGVVRQITLNDGRGVLVLEWIQTAPFKDHTWRALGTGLAELHGTLAKSYGYVEDNFIGSSPQNNDCVGQWPTFWRESRFIPQIEMARSSGIWSSSWDPAMERLLHTLDDLLPEHPERSLLHGDLWRGNVLADQHGTPVLIDPAVYFGHREADIAMTMLFGEFDGQFYRAYSEAWPFDPGHENRMELYNLYHLINHLNLFGGSYAGSVEAVLTKY